MVKSLGALSLVMTLTAFAVTRPAFADECSDAVLDYNAVLSRLTDAMERYSTCIADSKGTDDCSRPFRNLQRAHGQFASAVAIYVTSCR